MPKGLYSQTMCLLTDGSLTVEDVKRALRRGGYPILKEVSQQQDWCFGGVGVVIGYLPEINGLVSIDVVNKPWPDSMGNPKTDATTFGAWSMGQFGPFTFPDGLVRSKQHAWVWEEGRAVADSHQGFIRARMSYIFGGDAERKCLPDNYDPIAELQFLSKLMLSLFETRGALCYFNPNGEVLLDQAGFSDVWNPCCEQSLLPLPLWSNIRFFNVNDDFALMDTVGNHQMDIPDIEAIFATDEYDPADVDYYLRNVTHYLLDTDREIHSGEAFDGPGETNLSWVVDCREEAVVAPPRRAIRLFPKHHRQQIEAALAGTAE